MISDRPITDSASIERLGKLLDAFETSAAHWAHREQEERSHGHHHCAAQFGEYRRNSAAVAERVRARLVAASALTAEDVEEAPVAPILAPIAVLPSASPRPPDPWYWRLVGAVVDALAALWRWLWWMP